MSTTMHTYSSNVGLYVLVQYRPVQYVQYGLVPAALMIITGGSITGILASHAMFAGHQQVC